MMKNLFILFIIEYFFTLIFLYVVTSEIIHTNNKLIDTVLKGLVVSMLIYIGILLEGGYVNVYVTIVKFVKGNDKIDKTTILLISQLLSVMTFIFFIKHYEQKSKK
jgi:hypothetical protein